LRSVALRVAVVSGLAALAVGVASGEAAGAPACAPSVSPDDEAALTAMINQTRAAQRIPKVKSDRVLLSAGRKKSMAMANGGAFAHSAGASLPWAKGRAAGQNIAMAPTAAGAFQAMLASPGHRRNLLERSWRFTGVGVASRCDGMLFFTINLMAPPPQ
jgi:uncharacterized protein YkwD